MNNLKDLSRTLDVTNYCLYLEEKCLLLLISFISVLFSDDTKVSKRNIVNYLLSSCFHTSYLWPNCEDNVYAFRWSCWDLPNWLRKDYRTFCGLLHPYWITLKDCIDILGKYPFHHECWATSWIPNATVKWRSEWTWKSGYTAYWLWHTVKSKLKLPHLKNVWYLHVVLLLYVLKGEYTLLVTESWLFHPFLGQFKSKKKIIFCITCKRFNKIDCRSKICGGFGFDP